MTSVTEYGVGEVFGTTRGMPRTYAYRNDVDTEFHEALSSDQHIVLHGASRQGKSTLVKKYLEPDDYCVIQCSYDQKRYDVYRMLLREAGASVAIERKRRRSRGIGAKVHIFSADAKSDSESTERSIDIDIGNVNDVIRVIRDNRFSKTVVIEDFHYLTRGTQQNIAQDLKVIYEKSQLRFILVGVWEEPDRLVGLNGDLAGRATSVHVRDWTRQELDEVIEAGEPLLNCSFTGPVREALIESSYGCVGLLQQLCRAVCLASGVSATAPGRYVFDNLELAASAIERVNRANAPRLRHFISEYSSYDEYAHQNVFKWITHCLLTSRPADMMRGLELDSLYQKCRELYPRETADLTETLLLKKLRQTARAQRSLDVQPVVLEFDSNAERLNVVDRSLILFVANSTWDAMRRYLQDAGEDVADDAATSGAAVR